MDIDAQLLNAIQTLPPERRAEVINFVEFIKQRPERLSDVRPVGLCQGEFAVPKDFDAPLPKSVLREFEA